MKKTLLGLVCCALLCTGLLTPPASAAPLMGQEDSRLTSEYLLQVGHPLKLGDSTFYHRRDTPVFADPQCKYALDLIKTADGVRTQVYYDRQGNVYPVDDVLKEHYYYVFPFYEGLAAVIKLNNSAPTEPVDQRFKLGYVNTAGEEVIPCQYSVIPDCYAQGYLASRFKNGYAYVLRGEDGYRSFDNPVRGSIAKIDAQGKIVSQWTYRDNIMSTDIWFNRVNEPVFQELQLTDFTTDYSSPYTTLATSSDMGLTSLFDVPRTCDAAVVPMEKAGSSNDWTGVVVSAADLDLAQTATSRYQSTAELTNAGVSDLNYGVFELTVTNPTDGYDSGTVALVLASDKGTVHFVDYDLAPRESKTYRVLAAGHIANTTNELFVILGSGWGEYLNADIITFTDDADRDAYRATVPCEREELYYSGVMPQQEDGVHLILCYGKPGDDWLNAYTGITRKEQPFQYDDITHEICKP